MRSNLKGQHDHLQKESQQLRRLFFIFGGLLAVACYPCSQQVGAEAEATDVVHYLNKGSVRHLKGKGGDFSGRGLLLLLPGGQERMIESAKILSIETKRTPAQRAARLAAQEGQYAKAASNYYRLLETGAEERPWVRREILYELVLALRASTRYPQATKVFLTLLGKDPQTPYFSAIPLVWAKAITLSPGEMAKATEQLGSDLPVERLLGASLLLHTGKNQQAQQVLQQLATTAVEPIASLATTQRLRLHKSPATETDLQTCRQAIARLRPALRGGPYYILGTLYASRGAEREAAIASMRVAILYNDNPRLTAESLLTAGKAMIKSGLTEEGHRIYDELIATYPRSTAAAVAKQKSRSE